MEKKYKHKHTYFLMAGIFLLVGIVALVAVRSKGLPDSAMYIVLIATFGSAGKQLVWYFLDRDKWE